MSAQLPLINWPKELREAGPVGDPSILLTGEAKIGARTYVVSAIRVNDYRSGADYRDVVSPWRYEKKIGNAVNIMEFLMDTYHLPLLTLEGGPYLLWMTPADEE
jgi:hypothetical protein